MIESFVPETAVDPVYFEDTYYLGAGKNRKRGYRVLVRTLQQTHRNRGRHVYLARQTIPIGIRLHQEGLLLL